MQTKTTLRLDRYAIGEDAIKTTRALIEALDTLGAEGFQITASGTWSADGAEIIVKKHALNHVELRASRVRTIGLAGIRLAPTEDSRVEVVGIFESGPEAPIATNGKDYPVDGHHLRIDIDPETDAERAFVDELTKLDDPKPKLCPLKFRGEKCGYTGPFIKCNKTWKHCAGRENLENFGGLRLVEADPDPNCVGCGGSGEVSNENGDGGPCACLYRDFENGIES